MPDIDIDFCYERRSEVIDYVIEKYGKDCVTQIVTFGTLAARGVIRDVGRVMDLPYNFCDTIAKNIPNELNITIDKALIMNPELRSMYESDETVKRLIDMAKTRRSAAPYIHACRRSRNLPEGDGRICAVVAKF